MAAPPPSIPSVGTRRPLRILCADDDEDMALLTKLVLERAGHVVEHVSDGRRAWECVRRDLTGFDVVVTDQQMPHLTGLELTRNLRTAGFAGVIIVQSSLLSAEEKRAFGQLGVTAILQKPASLRMLAELLDGL